ncbi:hypothetical protein PH210_27280 [Paenibacillus sp. BSR1-1]|uniref:hypothetical protein n=1 Tax=Paenibacillus sp. BSR1-1 TaxID=3020845 RepID=UPI0025B0ADAA|nr:hypothetical protein [Paenibacillus sp. BSR1-1]MDN3019861.1 hypothetical protein [Paenibacillus sp. BSR1-1]
MLNKRFVLIGLVGVFIILTAAAWFYWVNFSKPASFPANEQLIERMNKVFPTAAVKSIQDHVQVDERHVFVPFVSEEGRYGVSYWEWKKNKWKLLHIDNAGVPRLWKINSNDPSTFYIVWNSHPDDKVSYMKLYFIRDRGFQGHDGIETYIPKIQLEKKVTLTDKSYGVLPMPADWSAIMKSLQQAGNPNISDRLFDSVFPNINNLHFGFIPFDQSNQEAVIMNSVNGSSFTNGDINLDYISILSKSEIEEPLEQ